MDEGIPDTFCILRIRADPDVEVTCRADMTMHREGMRSYDHEKCALPLEERQEISEIAVQMSSPSSPSASRTPDRITRTGASALG